jgi:hypothetical protein
MEGADARSVRRKRRRLRSPQHNALSRARRITADAALGCTLMVAESD